MASEADPSRTALFCDGVRAMVLGPPLTPALSGLLLLSLLQLQLLTSLFFRVVLKVQAMHIS